MSSDAGYVAPKVFVSHSRGKTKNACSPGTEERARDLPDDAHDRPMTAPTLRCIEFGGVREETSGSGRLPGRILPFSLLRWAAVGCALRCCADPDPERPSSVGEVSHPREEYPLSAR